MDHPVEYASALPALCLRTQLDKLDVIQRVGAPVNLGLPRDAHAAPLLDVLQFASLKIHRGNIIINFIYDIHGGRCHRALRGFF